MQQRNESLDALRGFAILTMVLSGSIAFNGILPAWMYHAQVPPPLHKFDPTIPGITWVDLVFPFFLFSMGAAIPLSLHKHITAGKGFAFVLQLALKRFALLAFFALFTQHMKAWVMADVPQQKHQLLSIFAFLLLCFQFYENRDETKKRFYLVMKLLAFMIAFILLWSLPFKDGKGFDFYKSDIIIMVLANMACFGTIIWYITKDKLLLRIGILPFIMAVFLSAKETETSWTKIIFEWKQIGGVSIDWLYKFYFLKYLFIILPGTFAGEWMLQHLKGDEKNQSLSKAQENGLALLAFALILVNLYALFTRELFLNLLASGIGITMILYILRSLSTTDIYQRFAKAGSYLLLLGLFFESYEGGIKKDPSTYSYYFVTGGLAFFMLILFTVISKRSWLSKVVQYFSINGKNPMVAYVAGNLLLLPLLQLTHTKSYLDMLNTNAWMGFLRGIVFTALVSLITIFFVKRKWFWKT